MKLTVIIPFLNEESNLEPIIKKVLKQKPFEIILVDDGSTDNSVKVIKSFKNHKLKLVKHQINQGKGAAIISGVKKAQGEIILIQDADLEYNPEDYPKLIKALNKGDFVIGTRRFNKKKGYLLAQLGNYSLTALNNTLYSTKLTDPYSCYKVGSRQLWESLKLESSGFEIEAEIVAKLALKNKKIVEERISYLPRRYTDGKKIGIKDFFKGVRVFIKLRVGRAI